MGRIRQFVEARGNRYWTLFDSGSRNTYVTAAVARHFSRVRLDPQRERLDMTHYPKEFLEF